MDNWEHLRHLFAPSGGGVFMDQAQGAALLKALSAASLTDPAGAQTGGFGQGGFRGLIYEDLEDSLKVVTYTEQQFANTLWKRLKERSVKASGLVHEFAKQTSHGGRRGVFTHELETVNAQDPSLERDYAQVCFLRDKRGWSHVSDFVKSIEDPEAMQVRSSTLWMMEQLERYLYDGDKSVNGQEFNGLHKIVTQAIADGKAPADHVIDLAGASLSTHDTARATLDQICETMFAAGTYGVASDMFMGTKVQKALDNALTSGLERILYPYPKEGKSAVNDPRVTPSAMGVGSPVAFYNSSFGRLDFNPHVFVGLEKTVYKNPQTGAEAKTDVSAPDTPTVIYSVQPATVAGSKFVAADAGAYIYRVGAVNASGESIPSASSAGQTVAAAGSITLAITHAGTGAVPSGYRIYRTVKGGAAGTEECIGRVAATAGDATFVDKNENRAGTETAYILDMKSEGPLAALGWAQLAPMSRYQLPMQDVAYLFMMFLYGTLFAYNPKKIIVLKNIGVS